MKVVGISSPCRYTAPCADKGKLRSKTKLSNKFLILSPPPYKKNPGNRRGFNKEEKNGEDYDDTRRVFHITFFGAERK